MWLATQRAYQAVVEATRVSSSNAVAVFASRKNVGGAAESGTDLFSIGTLAQVSRLRRRSCGRWVADLDATFRIATVDIVSLHPFQTAHIAPLADNFGSSVETFHLARAILERVQSLAQTAPDPARLSALVARMRRQGPAEFAGLLSDWLEPLPLALRQAALESPDSSARLAMTLAALNRQSTTAQSLH